LGWYPSASAFVITDIARDGMLEGPDIEGLTAVAARSTAPVIASGGVSSLADIAALANVAGITGIITGKAIYEGRFTIDEALRLLRR
jgi:phosphoribosylformimino-5-aminoimidazole carboxamide ribonucleotide (ProFAR) isomerase